MLIFIYTIRYMVGDMGPTAEYRIFSTAGFDNVTHAETFHFLLTASSQSWVEMRGKEYHAQVYIEWNPRLMDQIPVMMTLDNGAELDKSYPF